MLDEADAQSGERHYYHTISYHGIHDRKELQETRLINTV